MFTYPSFHRIPSDSAHSRWSVEHDEVACSMHLDAFARYKSITSPREEYIMWHSTEYDPFGNELFLAGEKVLPGLYRQIGGGREIRLEKEDFLPASLDGRVACYMCVKNTWGQISEQRSARL